MIRTKLLAAAINNPVAPAIKNPVAAPSCGNCQVKESLLLYHISHRGVIRRLCITCVLRLNPHSFCPVCFQVYPGLPLDYALLICAKCRSHPHTNCVAWDPMSPSPYICPLCVNPRTPIFKLKTAKNAYKTGEGWTLKNEECKVMDRDAAKKLLAAATIASASVNKAVVVAKIEAEKRAKEAAFMRKRATDALQHLHFLTMGRMRKKEAPGIGVSGNVGYVAGGFGGSSSRKGVGASTSVEEEINRKGKADTVNIPNQKLGAMDAAELRENEKMGGIASDRVTLNDDQDIMDVDEKGRMMGNDEGSNAERNDDSDVDIMS